LQRGGRNSNFLFGIAVSNAPRNEVNCSYYLATIETTPIQSLIHDDAGAGGVENGKVSFGFGEY